MKKKALILIAGWLLTCLIWGGITNPAALAVPYPSGTAAEAINPTSSFSDLDQFLKAIPDDYYTVKRVGDLKRLLQDQGTLLVDVREPSEFRSGHIPGAINIPLRSLTQSLDQIPEERLVVLYCSSGYRTAMGIMTLQMLGYQNVRGFPPSIQGWKAGSEPVVTSD
jgi:rhodanese-related sulfurtransferase